MRHEVSASIAFNCDFTGVCNVPTDLVTAARVAGINSKIFDGRLWRIPSHLQSN